jgi:drug/metabolite transporter (DMT)-like permease
MTPTRTVKLASIATLVLIWGTTWAVIRIGLGGMPPVTGVAARFGLAGIVLWIAALVHGLRGERLRAPWWLWLVQGVCTFCVSYGLVYWAEQWVPTGLTAVLFATFPLFVAVLAHFVVPGERLGALGVLGLFVGLGGVATLFSQDLGALGGRQVLKASALLLLSPFASAIAQVVVKRWGRDVHTLTLNAGSMVIASALMGLLAALVERGRPVRLDATTIGSLLYLALLGTAVTFTVYFWLLHHMPATHLALTAYLIPIVAVVVGAIVFDERVTVRLLAGGALVLLGTVLTTRPRRATREGSSIGDATP